MSLRAARAAALILVVLLATAGAPAQTSGHDPQAYEEALAAMDRLERLKSYRMRMRMADIDEEFVQEVVNPDRRRVVMRFEDEVMEIVSVGREVRVLVRESEADRRRREEEQKQRLVGLFQSLLFSFLGGGIGGVVETLISFAMREAQDAIFRGRAPQPGVWFCPDFKLPELPRGAGERPQVRASRLGDVTVDGVVTRGYEIHTPVDGEPPMRQRIYVLRDRGLPKRVETLDASGRAKLTWDYYDYDAPITIELPACGQRQ